jgi:hypothetical protein
MATIDPSIEVYTFNVNLRDYLAAQAMMGMLASGYFPRGGYKDGYAEGAAESYKIADAMLAARGDNNEAE